MCCDVMIIGSGIAGLSAAIEAKQTADHVLIIEKLPAPGGNSVISDGGIGVVGSDLQDKYGIEDSVDLLVEDMLRAGEHKNNEDLVRMIAKHSNQAYEWTKEIGVEYLDRVDFFGGHSVPRCLTPTNRSGRDIVRVLHKHAKAIGVDMVFNTEVTDIMIENGRATKATVRQKDLTRTYTIKQSLVIASGGFGSDKKMIEKYDKRFATLDSTNLPSAKGDMLRIMDKIGAVLIDMEEIQCGPWASPDENGFGIGPLFADYIALPYGILINPDKGTRFVNERADRKIVTEEMLGMPYALAFADRAMVDDCGWDLSTLIKKGIVRTFDEMEAIAGTYKMDKETLIETIDIYNRRFNDKKDDAFGKDLEGLSPLETPPFYVMKTVPKVHHTMGGIKIDTQARVIKEDGQHFKNIRAAGECAGGVHGASRLGSMAIMDCLVMGRNAGRTV